MSQRAVPLERLEQLWDATSTLTSPEVVERRAKYGANDIIESPPHHWLGLIQATARDPMLWFFAGTSALYACVGQYAEALTLLCAILPLFGMDLYLHRRTAASTEGLHSRLASSVTVLRGGTETTLFASELVPGDLVRVAAGEPLSVDGLFVVADQVQVDESALTGEAFPVPKKALLARPLDGQNPRVNEVHWGQAGTRPLTGNGWMRVVFTGPETVYGEIVRSAIRGVHESTPLQKAIGDLVNALLGCATALCVLLAAIRLYQGHSWLDALISAVTLAAAAIPEEFPVVFTFYLAVGVYRLAQRQALVRRAVTVESIGRVSYVCSDKTGTITEGRLLLTHAVPKSADEHRLVAIACLASRGDSGDPLDEAILRRSSEQESFATHSERVKVFPFTEDRKRETAIARLRSGGFIVASKGAAEVVLDMCRLTAEEKNAWQSKIREFAEGAHKVVAVASRAAKEPIEPSSQEPGCDFDFEGLLAFEDPVRDGVVEAVAACQAAGIHPIMVTGDHPLTARAVALEIGLGAGETTVISGDDVEELVRQGRGSELGNVDVIARAKPGQKLLLVKSLRELGEIVAVTGDGVNDVPALQSADIGVAMGGRGTRSAREVASIVLMDDNFRTIVRAIAEGRQLFRNLQMSFQYLLIIHMPLVLTATLIPLAGFPLLYLPVHVVWLEILIHPTALLVFQETAHRELARNARSPGKARFFSRGQWRMIITTGLLIATLVTAGFLRSLEGIGNVDHGRAMALAILTLASAFVTAALSRLKTRTAWIACIGTVLSSFVLIQTPKLGALLHLSALHWDDWALAIMAGLTTEMITNYEIDIVICEVDLLR